MLVSGFLFIPFRLRVIILHSFCRYRVKHMSNTGEHVTRVVDWDMRTCSCLHWQDEDLPCAHAAAVATHLGMSVDALMEHGANNFYRVNTALCDLKINFVPAPTNTELEALKGADQEVRALLYEDVKVCLPPFLKQDHGNKKNNRLIARGSIGAKTKARTQRTRSMAAALEGKKEAHRYVCMIFFSCYNNCCGTVLTLLCARCAVTARIAGLLANWTQSLRSTDQLIALTKC